MVSIVIVNWNTCDLLRSCLKSIQTHLSALNLEVIVVDNNSSDKSADMVASEFPDFTLIASTKNTGYAAGNNLGFAIARGDLILTLNPDTEFVDDSLKIAIQRFAAQDGLGALGACQVEPDGKVQHSVRGFPYPSQILADIFGISRFAPISNLAKYRALSMDYKVSQEVDQPMGTFLLLRRSALQTIGDPEKPFDEQFPIFFNEVDLCYRLKCARWKILYDPEVKILHHGGEGTKQVRKSMIWESHRSLIRYWYKHHNQGFTALALPFVSALVYLGAFVRAKGFHAGFRP